jgi:plasmid maintenance system antidote protein VapI
MCIEAGTTQAKLAQEIGTTPAYVNRLIRQKETVVNRTFTSMAEALGYDIQLTYIKRANN